MIFREENTNYNILALELIRSEIKHRIWKKGGGDRITNHYI